MDRFHLMTVFVAVAETEGFAAGARRLNMSAPAVTRAVAQLEEHLGVKLLNRTTRYVRTTEVGLRYLEDARRILAQVEQADDTAAGINAEPQGHIVVTAPILFGRLFVTPGIVEYLKAYPKVDVEALFLDRVVSLLEEGVDVSVRIGELPDSSMRARKVGQVRLVCCASPEYLALNGIPKTPDELHRHTLIASKAGSGLINWRFTMPSNSQEKSIDVKPRLTVTTNDAAIESALSGFGITRVLSYQVADYLEKGLLKTVLEQYEPATKPVHIVHREGRHGSVKVRTFIDFMVERFLASKVLN